MYFGPQGQMISKFFVFILFNFFLLASAFIYLSLGWSFSALSLRSLFKNIHQWIQRVNFHFEISCQRVLCALLTIHYSSSMDDKF